MSGQPRTQDALVRSLASTANAGGVHVIRTVATQAIHDMPQEQRAVATAMQAHALAVGNAIGNQPAGSDVTITAQTDFYYRDLDRHGHYARLVGLIVNLGQRTR